MKNFSPLIVLILLIGVVFWVNYVPGTFLTGWDNLHPEFNFSANIRRSFFSAWQEYKGTGVVEGQGLTADLPRQLILWGLSWIFPMDFLRWLFHFGMLLAGGIGIYVLTATQLLSSYRLPIRRAAAMVAAMFYLFNLATVQMFYVPFEPFSAHFGMLPWLLWSTLRFLHGGTRRSITVFIALSILSIPQGAVVTVFLVYMMILMLVSAAYSIQTRTWRRSLIVLVVTIALNAYWFFPTAYFGLQKSSETVRALNNIMSTETVFLKNKKYGTLEHTMLLKGYMFDNIDVDPDGTVNPQMGAWLSYLDRRSITRVGYLLFALSCLGMITAFVRRTSRGWYFFLPLLLSFSVLSNDAPGFSQFSSLFYRLPLFSQIFRFPFTKFSLAIVCFLAIFYAIGCAALMRSIRNGIARRFIWIVYMALPAILCFPVFSGKLISDKNRIVIPQEYFSVFEFFRRQPKNDRIANFPQHTFWEWMNYRWNYSGAGMLWFGIDQPILDRNWDPWGKENENYYHEIAYAIYSRDPRLFAGVLEKYQVRWLLIDPNFVSPSSPKESSVDQIDTLVRQVDYIRPAARFGRIAIYQVGEHPSAQQFVYLARNPVSVAPAYVWNNNDTGFTEYGHYISVVGKTTNDQRPTTNVYYPFRSLFTGRREEERAFTLEEYADYYLFVSEIPRAYTGATLILPAVTLDEGIKANENDALEQQRIEPEVFLNGERLPLPQKDVSSAGVTQELQVTIGSDPTNRLEIKVPKTGRTVGIDQIRPEQCWYDENHRSATSVITEDSTRLTRLSTLDGVDCMSVYLPRVSHRRSYIIALTNRHVQGQPLLFWLENLNIRRKDLELYLGKNQSVHKEYYVQPPMEYYGMDYSLHFTNVSIGKNRSINDLGELRIDPIPYRFLTSIKAVRRQENLLTGRTNAAVEAITVQHPNPGYYQIEIAPLPTTNNQQRTISALVLSQSYDEGWRAYEAGCSLLVIGCKLKAMVPLFFFRENTNHVLVNNWSNGWLLGSSQITNNQQPTTLILVFLPQYLTYTGFGLFIIVLGVPLLFPRRRSL